MRLRSIMILLAFVATNAAAQSGSDAPTIEQVEAQIKQAEQAAAEKARQAEAARQAEINRQAQLTRAQQQAAKVLADAAAKKATLVIKTDMTCQLSINGEERGQLDASATKRLPVDPGEQRIECVDYDRRVEQSVTVEAGRQAVVQLALSPPDRFERVPEGVKDNEQNLIWAESDNGSDINWNDATRYCSGLGSGWTLPSSAALLSMYDASGKYPVPYVSGTSYTVKPATPLIKITGLWYWANEQNGSSEAWYVGLPNGDRSADSFDDALKHRALCVRFEEIGSGSIKDSQTAENEHAHYDLAFDALKRSQYAEASQKFSGFLKVYP